MRSLPLHSAQTMLLHDSPDSSASPDDDPAQHSPGAGRRRTRVSAYLVFWLIGCVGLLIFRGDNVNEEGAEIDGFPPETLIAIALYTALVAIVYLMPQRKY